MEILFSRVIPAPIPEKDIFQSEIWGRDITFKTGDKIIVYADSGKGKTTFINILFGIRKDYSGDLFIDNKNIREFSSKEISDLRKGKFSIVPQGLQLFSELTVIENIRIKNQIQDFQHEEKIAYMLEILNLKGFENRKAGTLSFGQKQRVAIVRALCQSFDFILLDEAFSHIDTTNTEIAWDLIKNEVKAQDAGIILTSLNEHFDKEFQTIKV